MPQLDNVVLERDPFMERSENYISQEAITLDSTTGRIFGLQYGCFFSENLVVRKMPTGEVLRPMIDYVALHLQEAATVEAGREVLTVIRIDLASWAGDYEVDYHAFGGEYSTNSEVIQRLLEEQSGELENVHWGAIVGKPDEFNPAAHTHVVYEDIKVWNDMVDGLNEIRDAILNGGISSIDAIFDYIDQTRDILTSAIAAAITQHNGAASAHNKSAVGLPLVVNAAQADLGSINAENTDYLNAKELNWALFKGFSSSPSTVSDPRVITRPVQIVNVSIPELTNGQTSASYNQWLLLQGFTGNNVPENVTTTSTTRWQVVIGISLSNPASNSGIVGVRMGSGTGWTPWTNVGTKMLNNVPNYGAADTSAANIRADTTVDNKLLTPVVGAALSRNVIDDTNAVTISLSSGADGAWVQSDNLVAGKTYQAIISGWPRPPGSTEDTSWDNAGMSHRVVDVNGDVLNEIAYPAGTLLGRAVTSGGGTVITRNQVTAIINFTAPTGTNRRVRFGLDVASATNLPRGRVLNVQLTRLH